MSKLEIKKEEFTRELFDEVYPLLVTHYEEIARYKDIELSVNVDRYVQLQQLGMLSVTTARVDDVIVGYVCYMITPNLHYSNSKQAVQDVIYVDPNHRRSRIAFMLLDESEEQLKRAGVQLVMQHVKVYHDFSKLLVRNGYEFVEKIFMKRID